MGNDSILMDSLYQWFPNLIDVKSPNLHKISNLVKHELVDTESAIEKMDPEGYNI